MFAQCDSEAAGSAGRSAEELPRQPTRGPRPPLLLCLLPPHLVLSSRKSVPEVRRTTALLRIAAICFLDAPTANNCASSRRRTRFCEIDDEKRAMELADGDAGRRGRDGVAVVVVAESDLHAIGAARSSSVPCSSTRCSSSCLKGQSCLAGMASHGNRRSPLNYRCCLFVCSDILRRSSSFSTLRNCG